MENPKKPPDKYHVLKVPLWSVATKMFDYDKVFDAVDKMNKLVIHVYQFLELWILSKYHKNKPIPEITKDVVKMAFRALMLDAKDGPKLKGKNKQIYSEFIDFYTNTYKGLGYENKISGTNLSQIIRYTVVSIVTCIENNIKMNFMNYIKKFVNCSYDERNKEILDKLTGEEKKEMSKQLRKELHTVKEDIINNTLLSDKFYHKWIKLHRPNIIPQSITKLTQIDVCDEPQMFIKNMIYINLELEKLKKKLYQVLPLRKSIILHHIPIDTASIIDLFIDENKNEYFKNINKKEKQLWATYLKMGKSLFKMKNYRFNNYITTDAYTVSIHFIHKSYYEEEKRKKINKANAKKAMKEKTKDMTEAEKEKYKEELKKAKKEADKRAKLKKKEEFAKLSKEEQAKVRKENKLKNKKYVEFPYIEDLNEYQKDDVISHAVYCDPGKRDLFTFMDDDNNFLQYSNRQRLNETKRLKYQRLLQNYRDKGIISAFESELSDFTSKSCNYETFKAFVKKKNEINDILFFDYSNDKFLQYKWYTYINTQRSNAKLLNTIEKKYAIKEKDDTYRKLNIVMGDWSISKQMQNFISTPNITLKRLLSTRFNVYNIYEYNTSSLSYKTEEKCDNLYLPDKKNISRKLHSVLTYKMLNRRSGCINRDKNAVRNMKKLADYYFTYGGRPTNYSPKVVNPPKGVSNDSQPVEGTITKTEKKKNTQKIPKKRALKNVTNKKSKSNK